MMHLMNKILTIFVSLRQDTCIYLISIQIVRRLGLNGVINKMKLVTSTVMTIRILLLLRSFCKSAKQTKSWNLFNALRKKLK